MHAFKRYTLLPFMALLTALFLSAISTQAHATDKWDYLVSYQRPSGVATIDTSTKYTGCDYSIKITNEDFNCTYVSKTFTVTPNTHYRATVMAKYEGYALTPDATNSNSGASIGKKDSYDGSGGYTGSDWKKLTYEFDTTSETTYDLALWNGMYAGDCKGCAYFSDFELEALGEKRWDASRGNPQILIDKENKSAGSDNSIKLTNETYKYSYVSKAFDVKPNTHYRASVMAKCENFERKPDLDGFSGAFLSKRDSYDGSARYSGTEWKRLTYEFDTGNQTTYELALWNGMYYAECKGSVYYSDFKLEQCIGKKNNEWNVMVVVFQHLSAPVKINGKNTTFKGTLTDTDAQYMGKVIRNLYTSIPVLSDNKWKIKGVDVYAVDDTITELEPYSTDNYCIDFYSSSVSKQLDAIIEKAYTESGRTYNQIIAVSPINGKICDKWLGLGGGDYKGIRACQLNYRSGTEEYTADPNNQDYPETAAVHEMLHCIENLSRGVDPDNFVQFHANVVEYKNQYTDLTRQKGWGSWGAYHSDYMRCKTPDGRGVNAKVYQVADSYHYKTVYGNPATDIKFKKTDIQSLKVSEIADQTYTGKAIKPNVTIKDGNYKLVKDKDYTLSYLKNKNTGKACVIITGKGKYTGDYAKLFTIKPQTASISAKSSGKSKYKVSWKSIKGASKIDIYVAKKDNASYKLTKTVKGSETSASISASKGYKVKIRSYKSLYPQKYYSDYSKVVTLK